MESPVKSRQPAQAPSESTPPPAHSSAPTAKSSPPASCATILGFQVSLEVEKEIVNNLRQAKDLKALTAAIAAHREERRKFAKARKAAQAKVK